MAASRARTTAVGVARGAAAGLLAAALACAAVEPAPRADPRTTLPAPVEKLLARHGLGGDGLSVYVQDVAEGVPLLAFNAEVPRNPASVMKLVTTLVALQELGPAYRFQTGVYADAEPAGGRVEGNLYLKGGGDPFLVTENFWRLLKELRAAGVEHIGGDLVIDSSYFDVPVEHRGDFDGRPYRAYNVGPDAMLINFHATAFKFYADREAGNVRVVLDPPMSTIKIDNRIRLTKARCSWRHRRVALHVVRTGPVPEVRFSGNYPERCGPFEMLRAVADPVPYVFGAFEPMWREMGGSIDGTGRAGLTPDSAVRLHTFSSPPLAELIRYMNKFSNNVMTRNLLLGLGARTYGAPGTLEKGRRAIEDWLLLHDITAPELRIDNGSGLSRDGQVSALTLARLLLASWNSPFMPEFASSLPLAALDGTMRKRFRDSDLEGHAHLKTGLLNGTRALAGYLRTRAGRNLVVVALHNGAGVQHGSGTEIQDELLEWLFEQ